jgi:hypothetical protein
VTVEVKDKLTNNAAKNAQVILRPLKYRGHTYKVRTDEAGVARINVPRGKYQLFVSADGQQSFKPTVEVNDDVNIIAELTTLNWE